MTPTDLLAATAAALLGAFTWSLLEYVIHRWLGHLYTRNPFGREHQAHHQQAHYFAPTFKKIAVALPAILLFAAPVILLGGPLLGGSFALGFAAFYTTYEITHRRLHTHPPTGPWSRLLRRHHYHHHFRSARVNHGVTSPLWDLVFRTYVKPELIHVPERKLMPWLLDPEQGTIRPELQADYTILRQRSRTHAPDTEGHPA